MFLSLSSLICKLLNGILQVSARLCACMGLKRIAVQTHKTYKAFRDDLEFLRVRGLPALR